MENIRFTTPTNKSFEAYGLGSLSLSAAIRNENEVLCLVGYSKAYQPAGGRKTLKRVIETCEEDKTYYWKPIK